MTMTESTMDRSQELLDALGDARLQQALITALEKVPKMVEQYTALEKTVDFIQEVVSDRASASYLIEGIKSDLPDVTLNRDTLNAMLMLMDKLPKLVETLSALEKFMDLGQAVLNDKESINHLMNGAKDLVEPIQTKVKSTLSMVEEAKERAKEDSSPVTVFAMLKLLKDPNVQYGFHFVKALVSVMSERSPIR